MPSILDMNWDAPSPEPSTQHTSPSDHDNTSESKQVFRRFTPNGPVCGTCDVHQPESGTTSSTTSRSPTQSSETNTTSSKPEGDDDTKPADSERKLLKLRRKKKKRQAPSPPIIPYSVDIDPNALKDRFKSLKKTVQITNKQIWQAYRKKRQSSKRPPPPIPDAKPDNSNFIIKENNNVQYAAREQKWDDIKKPSAKTDCFETNWQALGKSLRGDMVYNMMNPLFEEDSAPVSDPVEESVYWAEESPVKPKSANNTLIRSTGGTLRRTKPANNRSHKRPAPKPPTPDLPEAESTVADVHQDVVLEEDQAGVQSSGTITPVVEGTDEESPVIDVDTLDKTSPPAPPKNPPPTELELELPSISPEPTEEHTIASSVSSSAVISALNALDIATHRPSIATPSLILEECFDETPAESAAEEEDVPSPPKASPLPRYRLNDDHPITFQLDTLVTPSLLPVAGIEMDGSFLHTRPSELTPSATPLLPEYNLNDSSSSSVASLQPEPEPELTLNLPPLSPGLLSNYESNGVTELISVLNDRTNLPPDPSTQLPILGNEKRINPPPLPAPVIPPPPPPLPPLLLAPQPPPAPPLPKCLLAPDFLELSDFRSDISTVAARINGTSDSSVPKIKVIPPSPVPGVFCVPKGNGIGVQLPSPLKGALKCELLRAVRARASKMCLSDNMDDVEIDEGIPKPQIPNPTATRNNENKTARVSETLPKPVCARSKPAVRPNTFFSNINMAALGNELKDAIGKREARRQNGTLCMRPFETGNGHNDSKVSQKSFHSNPLLNCKTDSKLGSSDVLLRNVNMADKFQQKVNENNNWVPANDLPSDMFEGKRETPTSRAREFHQQARMEEDHAPPHYTKHTQNTTTAHPKLGKMKRIQKGMKSMLGSLRRRLGSRDELSNNGWELYSAETFDSPPKNPVKISRVEHSPAYALNTMRGELYLIPNFDKILVTNDGSRIRERDIVHGSHSNVPTLSTDQGDDPIKLGHVVAPSSPGTPCSPIDQERQQLQDAETPFQVIQQMNDSFKKDQEEGRGRGPVSPVWKLVTTPIDPNNPYATIRSNSSGWGELLTLSNSPKRAVARRRTTSVTLVQSDDSDACVSSPRYSTGNSFRILWTNNKADDEILKGDRIVEGSECVSTVSPSQQVAPAPIMVGVN